MAFSLVNFEPRLYQQTIFASAMNKNTLVVLPTGLGKTAIAMMLIIKRLNDFPNSKVIFLAPTKPLVEQHFSSFLKYTNIPKEKMAVFTGSVSPSKRKKLWDALKVIFSTPQGLENDVMSHKVSLKDVSLIVFDEAHRSVGNYSYTFIAKQYVAEADFPLILALTASPGSDSDKIREVCDNLFIENVEVRTEDNFDVKPYVKEIIIDWVKVELPPEFVKLKKLLLNIYKDKINKVKSIVDVDINESMGKKEILRIQSELRQKIMEEKDYSAMSALSVMAQIIKVQYAIELLETQGISVLKKYFNRFVESASSTKVKAVKALMSDPRFTEAIALTTYYFNEGIHHPKLDKLLEIIEADLNKKKDAKIIVFTQYRDSASNILEKLKSKNITAKLFVGQQKKQGTGLSQKDQKKMLDEFRNSEFNVLVSTSVGEEGLDIPQVDKVIFYEPVPSAIRQIQRRGRTGRQEKGYVSILYTKGTRDEAYMWVARHKEKKMKRNLYELKKNLNVLTLSHSKNKSLTDFVKKEQKIEIIVDYREKNSVILHSLIDKGVKVNLKKLDIADYVLSSDVAVELKTVKDFVDSIIDGRLLSQVKYLKQSYNKPLLIVQGMDDLYSVRNVHKNAINGMILTITLNYGIPILFTRTALETADMLFTIAEKEQVDKNSNFEMHSKKPDTLKEQQEYVISSFPHVGLLTARELLRRFGSVKKVLEADVEELKKINLIGDKKAKKIKDVFEDDYKP